MTAAEFVFRHAGGCLIDTPDLEPARPGDTEHWAWVATVWQDRHRPDGWNALVPRPDRMDAADWRALAVRAAPSERRGEPYGNGRAGAAVVAALETHLR